MYLKLSETQRVKINSVNFSIHSSPSYPQTPSGHSSIPLTRVGIDHSCSQ